MRQLILLALLLPLSVPVFADAGPDDNPEQEWTYCVQESIKAEVWSKVAPEKAVSNAYRSCRPEFKALMAALPNDAARNTSRKQVARTQKDDLAFARKMANVRR
jgi:hypothetical protein